MPTNSLQALELVQSWLPSFVVLNVDSLMTGFYQLHQEFSPVNSIACVIGFACQHPRTQPAAFSDGACLRQNNSSQNMPYSTVSHRMIASRDKKLNASSIYRNVMASGTERDQSPVMEVDQYGHPIEELQDQDGISKNDAGKTRQSRNGTCSQRTLKNIRRSYDHHI